MFLNRASLAGTAGINGLSGLKFGIEKMHGMNPVRHYRLEIHQ